VLLSLLLYHITMAYPNKGFVRGTKGTVGMTGLTKAQLDYCNNLIGGESKSEAARLAYPKSNAKTVRTTAIRNWRNKNCQRYLEDQVMTNDFVQAAAKRLRKLIDCTKHQIIDGEDTKVADNTTRLAAVKTWVDFARLVAKSAPTDPEGAFEDTFWLDWYKQVKGEEPTPEKLLEFKGQNIEVEAEEVQARLFSSDPIKKKFSINPKDYIEGE